MIECDECGERAASVTEERVTGLFMCPKCLAEAEAYNSERAQAVRP